MKFNRSYILVLISTVTLQGFSQEILTKEDALKITLENKAFKGSFLRSCK